MNRPSPSQLPPFSGLGPAAEPTEHGSEPSHDALRPGTRLAEYEVLSVLGEGRFGIVYLAIDQGLQRQVAIKEFLPAALASRGNGTIVAPRSDRYAETFAVGLESFIDEARLLARFDHPALARVYRFWEANATAYMVMPYYEGLTVGAARRAMAHPPDEAWLDQLLLPLLSALDVLHGASCYPHDISPDNILLLADGRPVLLDFGAARHVIGSRSQALTAVLKPAFAPIEQYAESVKLRQGPWTNLYALAALAYYCVSGREPEASTVRALDDQMEPLSQVVDDLGRSFPELDYSVAFVSAIERALSVRPEERPQSVVEFRRALLGGRGAAESAAVPPPAEEAAPPGASSPRPASKEETAPFRVFLDASDGGKVDDASRERPAPSPPQAEPRAEPKLRTMPEWEARERFAPPPGAAPRVGFDDDDDTALRAALDAALRPDPADFEGGPHAQRDAKRAGGGLRALFMGVAAVALVVLGAVGWMMWSDYRDANGIPRFMTFGEEPEARLAPLQPPQPVAERPAAVPSGAASEPPLPPPGTAAPAAQAEAAVGSADRGSAAAAPEPVPQEAAPLPSDEAPGEAPPGEQAAVAEAPAKPEQKAAEAEAPAEPEEEATVAEPPPERTPPKSPAVAKKAPSPPPAKVANQEPDNPRLLCGPRTQFSLYRCMKQACERPKYYDHPECKFLRVTDAVRPLP